MKTALVCGVSGQDGTYLSQLLLQKGYRVVGTSRDAQISQFANLRKAGIFDQVTLESMSMTDFRSVSQVLLKYAPDEIYNLSGQSSVALSFEQPVETFESVTVAVLNLLEAIRMFRPDCKMYNASSGECFGETPGGAKEDDPLRPQTPYAVAKAAAFWAVSTYRNSYNLFACSGLLFNHESPLRPERFVTMKVVAAACRIAAGSAEKLRVGNLSIQRDWGWAMEYVEAMYLMMQQDKPDDYVIATGEHHSLKEFIAETFSYVGLDWNDHVIVDDKFLRPTDHRIGYGNPEKARVKLKWEAKYKMQDVIHQMVDYQRENRM